jgi:cytochrome c551/c552
MRIAYKLAAAPLIAAIFATASADQRGATDAQGTMVLPAIRYEAHIPAGGMPPAGERLKNPHTGDKQTAEAGAQLFVSMNCDGCHGGGAVGWVGPSLADGRWRYGGADDEIFYSIVYGRPKGMPAYGGVVGAEGIWMLVTYLKSLPVPDVVPTQSWIKTADNAGAAAASTATAAAAPVAAGSGVEGMLTKYGCVACHAVDKKIIGPAFKDIAAKYRGQKDVEKILAEKVRNGGVGVWGQIPMTPNLSVPDQDLQTIIEWVLALK